MVESKPGKPYGSARDLPSVRALEDQLQALRLLRGLVPAVQQRQLDDLERQLRRLTGLVERFYSLLGSRNWVFNDYLSLDSIEEIVDTDDTEVAEERLVSHYRDGARIDLWLLRLHRFEAMRPRMDLLRKALVDYEAGRFYSTVLVLLAVMDGFVNDLNKGVRKGLHTRSPEEMMAWDSMAGHHLGLSHAHKSFRKPFYKLDAGEVTELYRHGIMHGALVNFDNAVVATKAWNRLFAVADWAASQEKEGGAAEPVPSLQEAIAQWKQVRQRKQRLAEWQPHEYEVDPSADAQGELVKTCQDFLDRWSKQQWALVARHFLELGKAASHGNQQASLAKDLFEELVLSSWEVVHVRHGPAAVGHTQVELLVNGDLYRTELRWVRIGDNGEPATEWESGRWTLSSYGPSNFLKPEKIIKSMGSAPS